MFLLCPAWCPVLFEVSWRGKWKETEPTDGKSLKIALTWCGFSQSLYFTWKTWLYSKNINSRKISNRQLQLFLSFGSALLNRTPPSPGFFWHLPILIIKKKGGGNRNKELLFQNVSRGETNNSITEYMGVRRF